METKDQFCESTGSTPFLFSLSCSHLTLVFLSLAGSLALALPLP